MTASLINTDGLKSVLDSLTDAVTALNAGLAEHDRRFVQNEAELAALESRPPARRPAGLLVCASDSAQTLRDQADLVCPGADDQVALNQALAILPETGGTLHLAEGEYRFDEPLRIQSDSVRILGAGTGTRSNASGQAGRATFITGQINVEHASGQRPCYGVEIANLTIDSSPAYGINLWANNALVHHCHVHNARSSGIRVYGSDAFHPYNSVVQNCIVDFCREDGLLWDIFAADQHALGNVIYNNGGAGIRVRAGGGQIALGQLYQNDRNIVLEGGAQTQIQLVKIENALREGIYFDAAARGAVYAMITGCGFRYNGKSNHNTYATIGGAGNKTVAGILISGNRFNSDRGQQPNLPKYAVDVWGRNCAGWKVIGNLFGQRVEDHFGTGTINNQGLSCTVETI